MTWCEAPLSRSHVGEAVDEFVAVYAFGFHEVPEGSGGDGAGDTGRGMPEVGTS